MATGYYLTAIYLERGVAGLQQDPALALRYYRKAADEGNPQAQAYVGISWRRWTGRPILHTRCVVAPWNRRGKAAVMLGVNLQGKGYYRRAIEAFQLGVAAGDTSSALALSHGFDGPESSDELYYLAQQKDPERARRYKLITKAKILSNYSYASPTVPEINDIVPLPPAPLPEMGRQAEVAGGMGGQYPAASARCGADRETGAGETAEPGDGQAAANVTGL